MRIWAADVLVRSKDPNSCRRVRGSTLTLALPIMNRTLVWSCALAICDVLIMILFCLANPTVPSMRPARIRCSCIGLL